MRWSPVVDYRVKWLWADSVLLPMLFMTGLTCWLPVAVLMWFK